MLDLVVDDALEGVDVITRYRRFYAMFLADSDLHHDFITALELLEETSYAAGTFAPEPEETDHSSDPSV